VKSVAQSSLPAFRDLLDRRFSQEELRALCFDLEIAYENLPGATRIAKAQALLEYALRHGRLPALAARCRQLRPAVPWPDLDPPPPDPPTAPPAAGGIRAGRITAANVVHGIQQPAAAPDPDPAVLDAALRAGSIDAGAIDAGAVVSGLQRRPDPPADETNAAEDS